MTDASSAVGGGGSCPPSRPTSTISESQEEYEHVSRKMHRVQHLLDRTSTDATNEAHTEWRAVEQSEELFDLALSLQELNLRSQGGMRHLRRKLDEATRERDDALQSTQELTSRNESMKAEEKKWKKKMKQMEKLNYQLMGKMAVKALTEVEEWKQKHKEMELHNEELRKQVGDLTGENEELFALQKSMEDALQLATGMGEKMSSYAAAHEASVKGYEETLQSLREELKQAEASKEELSTELRTLKEENRTLRVQADEETSVDALSFDYYYDRGGERSSLETEGAYDMCRVLRQQGPCRESIDQLSRLVRANSQLSDESESMHGTSRVNGYMHGIPEADETTRSGSEERASIPRIVETKWQCRFCTFINQTQRTNCEMCEKERHIESTVREADKEAKSVL